MAECVFMESCGDANQNLYAVGTDGQFWSKSAGFVTYDQNIFYTGRGSMACVPSNAFQNNAGFASATNFNKNIGASARFNFRVRNDSTSQRMVFALDNGTGTKIYRLFISSGTLQLYTGYGTLGFDAILLGSSAVGEIKENLWQRICICHKVTGNQEDNINQVIVYLNGNPSINVSNQPLWLGGNNIDQLYRCTFMTEFGYPNLTMWIDDIYIDDDDSMEDIGEIRIAAKKPNSNSENHFDTAIGNNPTNRYENVNENPSDITNAWKDNSGSGTGLNPVNEGYGIEGPDGGSFDISAYRGSYPSSTPSVGISNDTNRNVILQECGMQIAVSDTTNRLVAFMSWAKLAAASGSGSDKPLFWIAGGTDRPTTSAQLATPGTSSTVFWVISPAIDECEDDGVNRRFKLDYVVDTQRPAQDLLNDMMATFGGFLVYSGSKVKLRVEKAENVTQYFGDGSTTKQNATFDPNNIVKDSFSWQTSSIDDRPNRLRVQWVDPDQNYVKVYTQVEDKIDQDERNTVINKDVSLLGITRANQASRMAKFIMGSAKYAATSISFSARLESIHCEVGDVIAVTHQSARFTRKLFRITSMQEAQDETIRFSAKEYNPSLYDDRAGAGVIQMATPSFVNPYRVLDDPENVTLTEGGFLTSDGNWVTTVTINWDALPGDQLFRLNYYLIQVYDGSQWNDAGTADSTSTSFKINLGLGAAGTSLTVRVRSVSKKGTTSPGNNVTTIVISGKTTPPSNVTNFAGAWTVDHVALSWTGITDKDLAGYEIRVGSTSAIWENAQLVVSGYLGTAYDVFNIAPGQKKFFIKAIDRSGNFSATAASATVTVQAVAGTSELFNYDLFSVISVPAHPLEGTLSSNLEKIPTNDESPLYRRPSISLKPDDTWQDIQTNYASYLALQNSFVYGREAYVTSQESWITSVIDLGSILTGTFILEMVPYCPDNRGSIGVQISTSSDGITFTSFSNYAPGSYTARYVQFKFLLQTSEASVPVRLGGAKLIVRSS